MFLVFDTETSGLPLFDQPSDDPAQPHVVDIAISLFDRTGLEIDRFDAIVNPGVPIPPEVAAIHGITTEICEAEGIPPPLAWQRFIEMVAQAEVLVGHNVSFDIRMMRIMAARVTGQKWDNPKPTFCTMHRSTRHCRIPSPRARHEHDFKWPRLTEAVKHFFGEDMVDSHRARPDCDAAARIFFHFREQGLS